MNLMLLDFNGLNKFEKMTLRCVIAYYIPVFPRTSADELDMKTILIQDLDKVICALRSRMALGPIGSERTLLEKLLKLQTLKNFEKKKEIRKERRSLEDFPAGLRPFLTSRMEFVKREYNDE